MVSATDERLDSASMLTAQELQYAPLEAKLAEWRLPFRVVNDFKVEDITQLEEAQVRGTTERAPARRIEEYAMQMRNGAQFPPILLMSPGNVLIDGNTRLEAAIHIGRKTLPALIVETGSVDMAIILAASINQMGGERLTSEAASKAAQRMIALDYPDAAIARELGRDLTQVRRWRNRQAVADHAEALGISDSVSQIPKTTIEKLANVVQDEPFKQLATLWSEVRPSATDAQKMVEAVTSAASEADAVKVVQEYREELSPNGPPPHAASRSELPLLRAACGMIAKFDGRPITAFDPRKASEELARWERVQFIAGQVVEAIKATPND